jgi:hypothetical protein
MVTRLSPQGLAALVKRPKIFLAPNFAPLQQEVAGTDSAPLIPKSLGCLAGGQPPRGNQGLSISPFPSLSPLWLPWQHPPAHDDWGLSTSPFSFLFLLWLPWQFPLAGNRSGPIQSTSPWAHSHWTSTYPDAPRYPKLLTSPRTYKTGLPFLGCNFSGPVLWGWWTSPESTLSVKPACFVIWLWFGLSICINLTDISLQLGLL